MVDRQKAATMSVPRGLILRFPFGRPFGAPGSPQQQRVVLEDALEVLATATEPGENCGITLPLEAGGLRGDTGGEAWELISLVDQGTGQ